MTIDKVAGYTVACDRCGAPCEGHSMEVAWKTVEAAQLAAAEWFVTMDGEKYYCDNCIVWAPNQEDLLVKPGIVMHIRG